MAKYPFLSDEWIVEVKKIHEEHRNSIGPISDTVRMNQVVTDVPFGEGTIRAHVDSSSGDLDVDLGHIEGADLEITLDYDTAKSLFVGGDPQAAIQAFMSGKIRVEGDFSKLMVAQTTAPSGTALEMLEKIKAVTAD